MKVPRNQMMNNHTEFKRAKLKGQSQSGRYMTISTYSCQELSVSKFAFVTSKKVGKAHERNFVRRRFRDLTARHGDQIRKTRYLVMIGKKHAVTAKFSLLEQEYLALMKGLKAFH